MQVLCVLVGTLDFCSTRPVPDRKVKIKIGEFISKVNNEKRYHYSRTWPDSIIITTFSSVVVVRVVSSACGGIYTSSKLPVLTAYFPVLA